MWDRTGFGYVGFDKAFEVMKDRVQATSLSVFASKKNLQVTTCSNGHVVVVEDGTLTDTGILFTEQVPKVLKERFVPAPNEGHPCTAAKDDEEGGADKAASSSDAAEASS